MYYDGNAYFSEEEVKAKYPGITSSTLQEFGILPAVSESGNADTRLNILMPDEPELRGTYYFQSYTPREKTVNELTGQLPTLRHELSTRFATALGEADYRGNRATQDITARAAEITAIDLSLQKVTGTDAEDLIALRAQLLAANTADAIVLTELRRVVEENRATLVELLTLEITDDMALQEAQEITLRIANAQPWLPWRGRTNAPTGEMPLERHCSPRPHGRRRAPAEYPPVLCST